MRQKQILFTLLVVSMICFGCKKDSETPDLAKSAAGIYTGTWTVPGVGQVAGTCEVKKVSNTAVDLIMTAGGVPTPTIPSVTLSDGGGGKINLSYSDASGTLNGSIQNNTISVTLVSGSSSSSFSGNR